MKQRLMAWCEKEIRAAAAEDIARVIEESATGPGTHCAADGCADCARQEQAQADAGQARRIGAEAVPPAGPGDLTADLIVQWRDVRAGDWVVYLGELGRVDEVQPCDYDGRRVLVLTGGSWRTPLREDCTAVRRYVNGKGGWA